MPLTRANSTPHVVEGRLTLESGVPVSTADQTGKTQVYFTPFGGNKVSLYRNNVWSAFTFTEVSSGGALGTITNARPYDVFLYNAGSALELNLTSWASDTARSTALTTQDGVLVKSGATNMLYVGTFRTTSTTTTEDSATKRFLWNYYNRVEKNLRKTSVNANWTYASATTQQADAQTSHQVEIIHGYQEEEINLSLNAAVECDTGDFGHVGIGENSLTTMPYGAISNRQTTGAGIVRICATQSISVMPRLGYSNYSWNEQAQSATTVTFVGSSAAFTGGLTGTWKC